MGQDLERIGRACQKFNRYPVCIVAFPEGTRFSIEKKCKQDSPYRYLLMPRVGGVAMALKEMQENLQVILDITLYYDPDPVSFWDLMAGKIRKVTVLIRSLPFPMELARQDFVNDPVAREQSQNWLNQLWREKDALIETCLS
jgi:1-acyl-sn-glycerol-3-phosphate acyltransferase